MTENQSDSKPPFPENLLIGFQKKVSDKTQFLIYVEDIYTECWEQGGRTSPGAYRWLGGNLPEILQRKSIFSHDHIEFITAIDIVRNQLFHLSTTCTAAERAAVSHKDFEKRKMAIIDRAMAETGGDKRKAFTWIRENKYQETGWVEAPNWNNLPENWHELNDELQYWTAAELQLTLDLKLRF